MVNASKILTVSYGTFSCTLEGFDDSFDTMKAIAEYFRDLAADDRYFGAEPPTPDAEMLARIAEREIARRVEAHEAEGNIVLRAANAANAAALTGAEAPAPQPAETPQAEAQTPEPEVEEPKAEEPAAEAGEPAEPVQEPVAEVEEPVEVMEEPVAEVEEQVEAEEPAETAEAPIEAVETPAAEAEEPVEPVEDLAEAPEEPAAEAEEPVEAVEVAPAEADDGSDSVAAKLRRIRSVVAHTDQGYTAADYTEDEHAQDFVDTTAAEMEMALEQDDIAQEQALSEDSGEDDLEALLSRFDSDDSEDDTDDEEPVAEATAPQADEDDTETADGSDLFEDTLAQLLSDSMPETADAPEDIAEESEPEEAEEATATPLRLAPEDAVEDRDETAGEEAGQPLLRARVVKMKRTEFEAAIAEGYIEEEEDDEGDDSLNVFDDASYDDSGDMGLSPEDEAELQRELAEVEAEMGFEDDEDYDEDYDDLDEDFSAEAETEEAATAEQPEPEAEEEPAPRGLRKLQRAEREGGDVNRMFDKTDTHLEEPESNRRRSVIQHLRAAVAATRAEKKAGAEMDRDVDDTPYRSDLAEVVRPRRPRTLGASRSARPTELRPAPLKLVAEQRVDDLAPREAVHPRRVSTTDLVADETPDDSLDGGFAEFADQMGASGLPELLEAAAAYLSDVEGRPQFSRPMLMGKLKEVKQDTFSREDGLRSFGQLLRDGKLQKLKGGRFTITDETDYRGEARNVG